MTTTPQAKKRGRPPTGQTPAAQRQRESNQRLAESGGKRITINLSAKAVADLAIVQTLTEASNARGAIECALSFYRNQWGA